ncbi:MAG: MATE family efflux transporter [Gammaproteobacteria bacterium]|nr:MATE family efflux transporter [Gammaproteobacteria bacterium]MCY4226135.1 MATE family efflux transporter [Gammaproteobacteria bacterium]
MLARFSDHTRQELSILSKIALPLIAAFLSEYLMFVTTKIVVGQLGYLELAAVGISGDLTFEVLVILIGLLSIVGVLCAQAEGSGDKKQAGLAVRQGFIISTAVGMPAMALIWNMDIVLALTNQDPRVVELARPFLHFITPSVLAVLYFSVLRSFVAALSRPKAVMYITVAAVPANYLLALLLVNGGWGIPALGLAGAGLAMTIVSWTMFALLLLHVYITDDLRGYGVFASRWKIDLAICREITVLGIPVAGLLIFEASLFTVVSILAGIINAETLAAYQITVAWFGIPFVVAIGIAEATMVRVAQGIGQGNWQRARDSGMFGMACGVLLLGSMIVFPVGLTDTIISIFISNDDTGSKTVSALATNFLMIAALFQVFDGLQAIAARALRGLKDSLVPLWIAGFGYWIMGIGGGVLLAFPANMQGIGLMWGLAMGLFTTGVLLAIRFHRLTANRIIRQLRQAELKNTG